MVLTDPAIKAPAFRLFVFPFSQHIKFNKRAG
jgi:hypothetical protein